MQGFERIAPFLTHPLVLVGFVVLLFFGMVWALLRVGIIPPLRATTGGKIVHTFLYYGFVIALVVIVLGFAFQWYRVSQDGRRTRDVVPGVKPALISIFNTRAVKDPARHRTQIELTFKNTGEIETVGYIDSSILVNGVDRKSDTLPPKQLTFAPNQPVTLVLYLSNRSKQGFDDIWSGRHPVEARVRLKFHAMPSQERTYLYRGRLFTDDPRSIRFKAIMSTGGNRFLGSPAFQATYKRT